MPPRAPIGRPSSPAFEGPLSALRLMLDRLPASPCIGGVVEAWDLALSPGDPSTLSEPHSRHFEDQDALKLGIGRK